MSNNKWVSVFNSNRVGRALMFGIIALLAAGCASQHELDASRNQGRAQDQRIIELEQSVNSWKQKAAQTNTARNSVVEQLAQRDATIASLTSGLRQAERDNDELMEQLNALNPVMLPEDVSGALEELAARYSDLMEFDSRRGMLRLASDMTFDLGSDSVRPEASATLKQVADVLKSADMSAFEIRIVGHTDNVPIRRASTKAKHPTNRHLSVHRAISVEQILAKAGLDPKRMNVMGWGSYRPIVPNAAKGGAKANRRVELFIVPAVHAVEDVASEGRDAPVSGKPVISKKDSDEPMK